MAWSVTVGVHLARKQRFFGVGLVIGLVVLGILPTAVGLGADSVGVTSNVSQVAPPRALRTSREPFGIAIEAQTGRAYVTDSAENMLFVLDVATGKAIAYVPTGRQPNHVVLAGGRAFVSNFTDASITVIDTATLRPLKILAVGGLGLALNPTTKRLYAAGGSRVSVLDVTTETLVATLALPKGTNAWGVAVDPARNRIYVTDIANPRVLVYDGATNALAGQVTIDAPARFGIAVGVTGQVFVASYTDSKPQLSVIDGLTAKVVGRVPIGAFITSLVVEPGNGHVDASSATDRTITTVDPVLGRVSSKVRLIPIPGGLAIGPSGELLVVTPGGDAPPPRPFSETVPVVRP